MPGTIWVLPCPAQPRHLTPARTFAPRADRRPRDR
jgi:hypothetical protein